MGKKTLTKQQYRRIKANQTKRIQHHAQTTSLQDSSTATVVCRYSNQVLLQTEPDKLFKSGIRRQITDVVAGDNVIWEKTNDSCAVTARLPRKTVLGRPDRTGKIKAVAANIDKVIIVSAAEPEVSYLLLDSYLIACQLLGLPPMLVFNKVDLNVNHKAITAIYEPLGYPIFYTSTKTQTGILHFAEQLQQKTSVLVGQSGVGKSSLLNALIPNADALTQVISSHIQLGKHTTSSSTLYTLPTGGAIIDSPGVRSFGLWEVNTQEITEGFIEMAPLARQCKFSNCSHQGTPGCAIEKALAKREISPQRYQSFMYLLQKHTKN